MHSMVRCDQQSPQVISKVISAFMDQDFSLSFSTVEGDALLLLEHSPPLLHEFDLAPEINEILSRAGPLLRHDHHQVGLGAGTGAPGADL